MKPRDMKMSTPVRLKPDTLDEENAKFSHDRLPRPLFLNSVPKSGSHLLRNIMRMFVPLDDHFRDQFIQWGNLQQYKHAFRAADRKLSWGHLLFSDASAVEAGPAKKIILVRDPHTWVLARARFFLSDEFGDNSMMVKSGELSVDALINLMIWGIQGKALPMRDLFLYNAVAWLGDDADMFRYEDMVAAVKDLDSDTSEAFFMRLFAAAGLVQVPTDWRTRVRIGSDRKQSGTARENLSSEGLQIPRELTAQQKAIIELAAPGLRAFLGYS